MGQISELIETYVMPYWPWIVGIIIGVMVLKYVVSRVVKLVGAGVAGGSMLGGSGSWLTDRGVDVPGAEIFSIGLW